MLKICEQASIGWAMILQPVLGLQVPSLPPLLSPELFEAFTYSFLGQDLAHRLLQGRYLGNILR